jgi:NitT/TauT family transport system substrate-binding protein
MNCVSAGGNVRLLRHVNTMNASLKRHEMLAALGAAGVALASPRAVLAQETLETVRVGVVPVEVCSEAFCGVDLGFFKKAGLDVQLEWFTSPGTISTGVASNAIDVGLFDTPGLITAHSRNVPVVLLAGGKQYVDRDPTFGVIVPADSPVRTAADFSGTFAVASVNSIAALGIMAWIDRNGGDSKRVKFVEMPFPTMYEAIQRRTVAGAVPVEPWLSDAARNGMRTILPINGIARTFTASCWATSRSWAEAHPATAARFAKVIYEIGRWANHNTTASIPIIAKYTKMPPEVISKIHRGVFAESPDAVSVQPVIDAAATYGMVAKAFPALELAYRPA